MPCMPPRITVLIATYNDERFIGAAIDSVLAQTFTDFELVIVDDASTDGTPAILEAYRDPRLRLIRNPVNLGPGGARNRGLAAITTEYVAQLDGDDVCLPRRLEQQVRYLDEHPEVAAVGAQAHLIDVRGRIIGEFRRPVTELGIRWCGVFQSPMVHSSAAYRRAIVQELGGYEEHYAIIEDFDLWSRLAKKHQIHNLDAVLVEYRAHATSMTGTPGHPSRAGHVERKTSKILANLRDVLGAEDISAHSVRCWVALQSDADVREALSMIEQAAARFRSRYGENDDSVAHQATMLLRAMDNAGRILLLRVWIGAFRRHRRTALRALPRFAARFALGKGPLRTRLVAILRGPFRWYPFERGRGWILRIARLFLRDVPFLMDIGGGIFVAGTLDDAQSVRTFIRDHERDRGFLHSIELVPRNGVAIDAGANNGLWSLPVAGRGAVVHAFEPVPAMAAQLRRNIELNRVQGIVVNQLALADQSSRRSLYAVPRKNTGASSLSHRREDSIAITVDAVTIDEYVDRASIARVDLLKADVEGAEILVFRGARRLLSSDDAPIIFFEIDEHLCAAFGVTTQEVKQFLAGCGYGIFRWNGSSFDAVPMSESHRHEDLFALKPRHRI